MGGPTGPPVDGRPKGTLGGPVWRPAHAVCPLGRWYATRLACDSFAVHRVCITIDTEFPDRPCSNPLGALDELLEVLAERSTPAVFFVVGTWARVNPERASAIHAAGHQVGNHSYSHCNLARMTEEGIVEDLTECRQTLAELGIESRPWFRAPYGEMTSSRNVRNAVKRAGYEHIPWHADGGDWQPGVSATAVAEKAFAAVQQRWPRRATVLFHSWPDAAPRALAMLLDELSARGADFTTPEPPRWRRQTALWHGSR
jgi:peptidoglycan/xylan/chitin deacetylase (PgdA/CDA1 family)